MALGDTVFTISGPPDDYGVGPAFNGFGDAGAPDPHDIQCANEVARGVAIGAGARLATIPLGLFGVYKLLSKSPAAGVTSLIAGLILWGAGGLVLGAAEERFHACTGVR